MNFTSTRGGVEPTPLRDAILAGLAPDGGLFVPESLPVVAGETLHGAESLPAVAQRVLQPFVAGSPLEPALGAICAHAYAFDAPLAPLEREDADVLELFHGPTAAFKDFGARFLAASIDALRAGDATPLTVLVATSGDTGSAVGAAFHRMPGVRVAILYPDGRVSPRQAHQLGCFGDNVHALRVEGTFDDCQRMVKRAFADAGLRARVPLASANSISLGRLLPQMAYYARAALAHELRDAGALNLIVPTGNLGNAFAAMLARALGLPIGEIVLATNANRVLPDFLASGRYEPRAALATLANAMDVGDPSNVERLRWLYADAALRRDVRAIAVEDAAIRACIADGERRYGRAWCPHTACAVHVLERLRAGGDERHWVVVATAHAAKFETIVEPLLGHVVEPPPALARMLARETCSEPLAAGNDALERWLDR